MENPAHILIVDDDREISSLLAEYLEKNGYRAFTAGDGKAMWKTLDEARIDLVYRGECKPGMVPGDEFLATPSGNWVKVR